MKTLLFIILLFSSSILNGQNTFVSSQIDRLLNSSVSQDSKKALDERVATVVRAISVNIDRIGRRPPGKPGLCYRPPKFCNE